MIHDSISVPFEFLRENDFCRLQLLTRESAPTLLGRLVILAVSVATQQRVRFAYAEIDHLTCWPSVATGRDPFAEFLLAVGWARRSPADPTSVDVALPAALQHVNPKRLAGQARAKSAGRDDKGRYLTPPGKVPRAPRPARVRLDGEGNVVEDEGVAG
jgi:hypothetical protein